QPPTDSSSPFVEPPCSHELSNDSPGPTKGAREIMPLRVWHGDCIIMKGRTGSQLSKGESMGLLDFVILLVVAGVCGAIGKAIAGYSRGGCLVSIALGFIGALLG